MPADGTGPEAKESVAGALASARASLESQLDMLPGGADWRAAAHSAATDCATAGGMNNAAFATDNAYVPIHHSPAFRAYVDLLRAEALLPRLTAEAGHAAVVAATRLDPPSPLRALDPRSPSTAFPPPAAPARSLVEAPAPHADPVDAAESEATVAERARRDDLTRIRGIDVELSRRLAAIGILRFAQVAQWTHDDVKTIAMALGLGRLFAKSGVIEQAQALEAERIAKSAGASAAAHLRSPAADRPAQAIAVWEPPRDTLRRVDTVPAPQSPNLLAAAVARLRAGVTQRRPIAMSELVPEIAAPVFVAIDEDHRPRDVAWRPTVLAPFIEAPDSVPPAKQTMRHATYPATTAARGRMAEPESLPVVEPPAEHLPISAAQASAARLAAVEQEIERLRTGAATAPATAAAADSARRDRAEAAGPAPAPQAAQATIRTSSRTAPPTLADDVDVAEADVEIIARPPTRRSMLTVLPELPLRRASAAKPSAPETTPSGGSMDVGEAAVIIVQRRAGDRAAPDLPFYHAQAAGA